MGDRPAAPVAARGQPWGGGLTDSRCRPEVSRAVSGAGWSWVIAEGASARSSQLRRERREDARGFIPSPLDVSLRTRARPRQVSDVVIFGTWPEVDIGMGLPAREGAEPLGSREFGDQMHPRSDLREIGGLEVQHHDRSDGGSSSGGAGALLRRATTSPLPAVEQLDRWS